MSFSEFNNFNLTLDPSQTVFGQEYEQAYSTPPTVGNLLGTMASFVRIWATVEQSTQVRILYSDDDIGAANVFTEYYTIQPNNTSALNSILKKPFVKVIVQNLNTMDTNKVIVRTKFDERTGHPFLNFTTDDITANVNVDLANLNITAPASLHTTSSIQLYGLKTGFDDETINHAPIRTDAEGRLLIGGTNLGVTGRVTVDGTNLGVTGRVTVDGTNLGVTGRVTVDGTNLGVTGRVTVDGTNLGVTGRVTVDGTNLGVTGRVTVDGTNLGVTGRVTVDGTNLGVTGRVTVDGTNLGVTGRVTVDGTNLGVTGRVSVDGVVNVPTTKILFSNMGYDTANGAVNTVQIGGDTVTIYSINLFNNGTVPYYAKFYRTATVAEGTAIPDMQHNVPPAVTRDLTFPRGINFNHTLFVLVSDKPGPLASATITPNTVFINITHNGS